MPEDFAFVDEGRSRRLSVRTVLASLLVFALTGAAGLALLARWIPPYLEDARFRASLAHLEAHRDRYDTLFIGSSRVRRQIQPALFDAATAAAGVPTKSFNLGANGMVGLELEFVLEQALALELPGLRWVWIDPGDVARRTRVENRPGERFVAWHDLRHTWRALDLLRGGERPRYDARSWTEEHLPALARNLLRIGRAPARLRPQPFDARQVLGPELDGYHPLDENAPRRAQRHRERFLADLDGYRERREALARRPQDLGRPLEPFERRYLLRLRRRVERAGAQPILLAGPALGRWGHYVMQAAAEGLVPVAFNYADPARYPDLYAVERRFDAVHLNHEGASLYTRHLARDFVRHAGGSPAALSQQASLGGLRTGSR